MSKELPANPNLEFDKKQAKALLKAYCNQEAEAFERVKAVHPRLQNVPHKTIPVEEFALSDAQLVIAKEYGFSSWPKLKHHIEAIQAGFDSRFKEFIEAVQHSNTAEVRKLLQTSPQLKKQINAPVIDFDAPPILIAAGRKNQAMVELLLEHGADINAKSVWWAGAFGALHGADSTMAEFLIERGAKLDVFSAAEQNKLDELASLIEAEPSLVHAKGPDGQRALHFARSREVIDYLLEKGADIDARDIDHCGTAAQWMLGEHSQLCRYLLERGASADIFMAARLGDLNLIQNLLEVDSSLADKRIGQGDYPAVPLAPGQHIYIYSLGTNKSPHQLAKQYGHSEAYALLLKHSSPKCRFIAACERGDMKEIQSILSDFPSVGSEIALQDQRLLGDAAWDNKLELVKLLLELGFDPQVTSSDGLTPLHSAAFHGFVEIVNLLLKHNPSLEHRNTYGGRALETAIHGSLHSWRKDGDFPATVEALLKAGSKPAPDAIPTGNEAIDAVLRPYMNKP